MAVIRWACELPVTVVDEPTRTWTAEISGDLFAVDQSPPHLTDGVTVTYHVPEVDSNGQPVEFAAAAPTVGQTVISRQQINT